jgi:hypothetical protein
MKKSILGLITLVSMSSLANDQRSYSSNTGPQQKQETKSLRHWISDKPAHLQQKQPAEGEHQKQETKSLRHWISEKPAHLQQKQPPEGEHQKQPQLTNDEEFDFSPNNGDCSVTTNSQDIEHSHNYSERGYSSTKSFDSGGGYWNNSISFPAQGIFSYGDETAYVYNIILCNPDINPSGICDSKMASFNIMEYIGPGTFNAQNIPRKSLTVAKDESQTLEIDDDLTITVSCK